MSDNQSLFLKPLHPYTQASLSAIPILEPKRKKEMKKLKGEVPFAINIPLGCRSHPRCHHKGDKCTKQVPQLIEIEKRHFVECNLY